MKILTSFFVVALCLSSVIALSARTNADDLTGKWTLTADAGSQTLTIAMDLKQTGEALTGTTSSDLGAGTIDGGKVTGKAFTAILHAEIQGNIVDFKMEGTFEGDKLSGSFTNPQFGAVPFTATRNK
jgi:hypothetical protein